ncbi:hypothetical protein T05_6669, partial [Trichinella murrelli]
LKPYFTNDSSKKVLSVSLKSISYVNISYSYRDSNPDMTISHNPRQV